MNDTKVIKNIFFSSMQQIISLIIPIITTPYVTRIFSAEQLGLYGKSFANVTLIVVFCHFGLNMYGVREIGSVSENLKERSNRFFELWSIQLVISCIIFFISELVFKRSSIYQIQLLLVLINAIDVSWFFVGIENLKNVVLRNISTKIIALVCILLFVKKPSDMYIYIWINVAGVFLGNILMLVQLNKFIDFKSFKFKILKNDVRGSFKLLIPNFLFYSKNSIDKNILYLSTSNNSYVGLYDQSVKLLNITFIAVTSGLNAILPRMSSLYSDGNIKELKLMFYKAKEVGYIFSLVIITGLLTVLDYFIPLFFGKDLLEVGSIMNIMIFALLFYPISNIIGSSLQIPMRRDDKYLQTMLILVISLAVLNFVLDQKYFYFGAAISFVVVELIGTLYRVHTVSDIYSWKEFLLDIFNCVMIIIIHTFIIKYLKTIIIISSNLASFFIYGFISVLLLFSLLAIKKYIMKPIIN